MSDNTIRLPLLDRRNAPQRTRLALLLGQRPDRGLDVRLRVHFDSGTENHDRYGETLDIHYRAQITLADEREEIWRRLRDIYSSQQWASLREEGTLAEEGLQALLSPLAEVGSALFYRLFHDIEPQYTQQPDAHRDIVRQALAQPQRICIEAPMLLFPWSFLYDDADFDRNSSELDPERFWGFKHEIQQTIWGTNEYRLLPAEPVILSAIGLSGGEDPFTHLNLQPIEARDITMLKSQLTDCPADCFYFYGHAHHARRPGPATSWLQLRDINLTVDMLSRAHAPRFRHSPVVAFFNGCGTAQLHEWDEHTMVGHFVSHNEGKLCCIATVAEVPIAFAQELSLAFWRRFLDAERPYLGQALLEARREFLTEKHNPLGLLYEVFGKLDTQVAPRKEDNHA